jgi:hypothetical protein
MGLWAFGPFYETVCPFNPSNSRAETRYIAGDGFLVSSVGRLEDKDHLFVTDNKEGYLTDGPYLSIPGGSYSVTWSGLVRKTSEPQFEVISEKGLIKAHRVHLEPSPMSPSLETIVFGLDHSENGVQFRVFVGEHDSLGIKDVMLVCSSK